MELQCSTEFHYLLIFLHLFYQLMSTSIIVLRDRQVSLPKSIFIINLSLIALMIFVQNFICLAMQKYERL